MTRLLPVLAIALGMSACAARTNHSTVPVATRSEVLAEYLRGESFERLAREFKLGDRDDARDVVHDAMISVARRYYHER